MSTGSFLSEFPAVSTQDWERVIREDLKEADYDKKLKWRPEEGLALKPYYRAEDLAGLGHMQVKPGESSNVRSPRIAGGWRIREEIVTADPEEANREACAAVGGGAEEIAFREPRIKTNSDLALLLANLDEVPAHVESIDRCAFHLVIERLRRRQRGATLSTGFDPFTDLDLTAEVIATRAASFVPFQFHAEPFQEQGATAGEEIGFALAAAVDVFAEMKKRDVAIDRIADSVSFSFAIGPDFFIQIAKFRAFRAVFAQSVESFGGSRESARPRIHACTPRWNRTVYDPHVNILRATTEAMSAVFGGADSISVAPFDECFRQPDHLSRRLARNTQIILKQEAYLAHVTDPGGGSYCLEAITDLLARKAWELLQKIESEGGYQKAVANGMIAAQLNARARERVQSIAQRKRVLTGTNRFADASEKALGRITLVDAEGPHRAAHTFERLRLQTERHALQTGKKPRILLLEIGDDRKSCTARSQFSADLLACAGLESHIARFQNVAEIDLEDSDLIVLCSSDSEYPAISEAVIQKLKTLGRERPVLVAGQPEMADQLRAAGIVDFIHVRSNAVETLARIQHLVGIKD